MNSTFNILGFKPEIKELNDNIYDILFIEADKLTK